MIRMYRIFLVEDDKNLAELIENQLMSFGNDLRTVSDFRNVMEEFLEYDPHLVLMDIGLPHLNGFHWCEKIREISDVPVIHDCAAVGRAVQQLSASPGKAQHAIQEP